MLPLLVVLFVISYSLLLMLVIEQNSTITNQRWLIKQLLVDSTELSAMKSKAIQKHNAEVQAQAQERSKTQAETPSAQARTEESARTDSREKERSMHPQHPPKPASDASDVRRALLAI